MASSITLMPYMMDPGEDRVLADAIFKVLSNPGSNPNPVVPGGTPAAMTGNWAVTIHYSCGTGEQVFILKQNGNALTGEHKGEIYEADLQGSIHGDQLTLRSNMEVPGNGIHWTFEGSVRGNTASGNVNMGEYGPATWTATKA